MFLRNLRLLTACLAAVAAVCVAPARSEAGIQVLVEELDASSAVVGSSSFFSGTPSGPTTFFQGLTYSSPTGHFTLSGQSGTNSHLGTLNASLSTSFTGGFTGNFDPSQGHTLRLTVTDDGYASNGQPTVLLNSAGVAFGFAGGTIQVDAQSRIYNPSDAAATTTSSATTLAGGLTIGGPTPVATDSLPPGDPALRITQANVSGLPTPYAIQQVIILSFVQTGTIDTNSTFTGSAGARVDPSAAAVPAPGGLALALIGLPLIGLRRALRKRAVA